MFAVSGLAAWLIDNRPLRKFICFLLIFIPVGDISTVLRLPGATGAQRECGAGSGTPLPQSSDSSPGWSQGERPGRGVGTLELEERLSPRVGREGANWIGSLEPQVSGAAAQLLPTSCLWNKGLAGCGRSRLGSSPGRSASSEGLGGPPPRVAGDWGGSSQTEVAPTPPRGPMVAEHPGAFA